MFHTPLPSYATQIINPSLNSIIAAIPAKVERLSSNMKGIIFLYCRQNILCIIEVYFESHLIYKLCYYRQTIYNQLNIMVSYVDIIGLYICHSVTIL